MKKIYINDDCTSCGLCEDICPEVFELQDIAVVRDGVDINDYADSIREAADSCPVDVIIIEE